MTALEFTPKEAAALLQAISAHSRPDNVLHSAGEKLRGIVERDQTQSELAAIRAGGPVPLDVALSFVIVRFIYDHKHSDHFDAVSEMVFRGLDLDAKSGSDRAVSRIRHAFPSIACETAAELDDMMCVHSVLSRDSCRQCVRDYLHRKRLQYGATVPSNLSTLDSPD